MSISSRVKICPSCQQPHPTDAQWCVNCRHQFRTKFAPDQHPAPQAAAISSAAAIPAEAAPRPKSSFAGCVGWIVALIIISQIASHFWDLGGDDVDAEFMARQQVATYLKFPDTAKFSDIDRETLNNKEYIISGTVASQDDFGLMVQAPFQCKLKYIGKDKWHIEYVNINNDQLYTDAAAPDTFGDSSTGCCGVDIPPDPSPPSAAYTPAPANLFPGSPPSTQGYPRYVYPGAPGGFGGGTERIGGFSHASGFGGGASQGGSLAGGRRGF